MRVSDLRRLYASDADVRLLLCELVKLRRDAMQSGLIKVSVQLGPHGLTESRVESAFEKLEAIGFGTYDRTQPRHARYFSWPSDMGARVVALLASSSLEATLYDLMYFAYREPGCIYVETGSIKETEWLQYGLAQLGYASLVGCQQGTPAKFRFSARPFRGAKPPATMYMTCMNWPKDLSQVASTPARKNIPMRRRPLDYGALDLERAVPQIVSVDMGPMLSLDLSAAIEFELEFHCQCGIGQESDLVDYLRSWIEDKVGVDHDWQFSQPHIGCVMILSESADSPGWYQSLSEMLHALGAVASLGYFQCEIEEFVMRLYAEAKEPAANAIEELVRRLIPCMRAYGPGVATDFDRHANWVSVKSTIRGANNVSELLSLMSLWTSVVQRGLIDGQAGFSRFGTMDQSLSSQLLPLAASEDLFEVLLQNGIYLPFERAKALHELRDREMRHWVTRLPRRAATWQREFLPIGRQRVMEAGYQS